MSIKIKNVNSPRSADMMAVYLYRYMVQESKGIYIQRGPWGMGGSGYSPI